MDQSQILIQKLKDKSAHMAVLGLGYVGLPLAVVFAESGFKVTGIDPIASKVDQINQGKSYILDIEDEQINKLVQSGKLSATTDFSVLADIDAVSICVPTPLRKTGDPDLSFIHLRFGILEGIRPQGYGHCAGIYHLPRYHTRDDPAQARRREKPESRQKISSWRSHPKGSIPDARTSLRTTHPRYWAA